MNRLWFFAWFVSISAFSPYAAVGESILDQLRLGELTPDELNALCPGTRTEIPKGNGQIVMHFQDVYGNRGECRFFQDRLFGYTITLNEESPDVVAAGGWDRMCELANATFGAPKLNTKETVAWDLEHLFFSLCRKVPLYITITLCDKAREQAARRQASELPKMPTITKRVVYGGPHFFSGFRRELTRKVELIQGSYYVESTHKGRGNFIVYMHTATSRELVANEIGHSYSLKVIHVEEPVEEVFFELRQVGGPWEIRVKKLGFAAP